jgi:hypothetical protein
MPWLKVAGHPVHLKMRPGAELAAAERQALIAWVRELRQMLRRPRGGKHRPSPVKPGDL